MVRDTGDPYRVTWDLATVLALRIVVTPRRAGLDGDDAELGPPQLSGGQEYWIVERSAGSGPIVPAGGVVIVWRTATCRAIAVIADASKIPREQQLKLIESFGLLDCANPAGWAPLP